METLKNIFKFYINSSIHVAIAACALVQITFVKYGYERHYEFLLFVFFGAVVAYNFVKYSNVSKLYHRKLTTSMKWIRLITIICSVFFVYFAFQLSYTTLLYVAPLCLLTLFYVVPVFPNKKSLRSVAGVKIFIIAIVWTGITVVAPIIHMEGNVDFNSSIEIIQRFLFIVIMMLPFEIRDLDHDDTSLVTVPQKIGITRTKVFGSVLLMLFLLLTVMKDILSSTEILSTIMVATISLLFLWGTNKKQSEYYCSFWVESVPLIWLAILIVLQSLFG